MKKRTESLVRVTVTLPQPLYTQVCETLPKASGGGPAYGAVSRHIERVLRTWHNPKKEPTTDGP